MIFEIKAPLGLSYSVLQWIQVFQNKGSFLVTLLKP